MGQLLPVQEQYLQYMPPAEDTILCVYPDQAVQYDATIEKKFQLCCETVTYT